MSKKKAAAPITGLTMSGGGARGAYAAGVVFGINEVLGLTADVPSPFDLFSGTSAGSINCGWFAAYAHRGDLGGDTVRKEWLNMTLESHIKIRPQNLFSDRSEDAGRSLLDPAPFEKTIGEILPWAQARRNLREGHAKGVMLTATELSTGRSVWFTQMGKGYREADWADDRRTFVPVQIDGKHALASSAIPFVFPPRRVDNHFYCDGGVRCKTPISAVIRGGAERLVVVSLRSDQEHAIERPADAMPPKPLELFGKMLSSVIYDTALYDLERLEAINEVVEVMEQELDASQRAKIQAALERKRGAGWRKVPTLSFRPTIDFGQIAIEHARDLSKKATRSNKMLMRFLESAGRSGALSFILFDRHFTNTMLEMGREEALRRADDIKEFFPEYQ